MNELNNSVPNYGSIEHDAQGNIVAVVGMELRFQHVPEIAPEKPDYWFAWVDGVQWDGLTRNQAILSAIAEKERQVKCREYFESGCLCILNGELEKLPETFPNLDAIEHYENACVCSRNYIKAEGHCLPSKI